MNFDKPFELRTEKGLKQVQKKFDAIPVHLTLYFHIFVFQPQEFSRKRRAPAGRPDLPKTLPPGGCPPGEKVFSETVFRKNKNLISEPYKYEIKNLF